jgi:DHA2 family methylenomycin A resistance protein-like MFS transporter
MLGFFVVALDAQIVNVTLPAIRTSLDASLSSLQWIVTAYTLMFAALQLFSGTVSDRVGARRAYAIGMVLFVVASTVCGFAPTMPLLIAGRAAQGIGAAMITPTSLALIREAFHDTVQRGRAIAYWAMGGSIAAAAGPVVGGALAQIDWRLVFWVNIPVGAVALMVLARVHRSQRRPAPFDWVGQVSAVLALGGLTYAIIEGAEFGYGSLPILSSLVLAITAGAVFVRAQARGAHPMVPLDLFRSRYVAGALSIAFVTMAAFYGVVFLQSLYFQQERGLPALATGLLFLPMTALVAILNPLVPRLAERLGRLVPIVGGQLLMACGLVGLCLLPPDAPVLLVATLMVPVGVGGSFTVPPLTSMVLDHIPAERAGTASGVLNTARQMGGSLGVAVCGAFIAAQPSFRVGLQLGLGIIAALLVVLAGMAIHQRGRAPRAA